MRNAVLFLAASVGLAAQALQPGAPAPAISAPVLDPSRPFPGWEALRGNFVVVDFWATWCRPCLPGLDKIAQLEKEFAGRPILFLTVASDTPERVKKYYAEKGITLQTFVAGDDSAALQAFGVNGLPATAVIDPQGRMVGVTPGENVTAATLQKLLAGEKISLPRFERPNNITWDQDEITWNDGVLPLFQVIIKPIEVTGGGYAYRPGSNRISGDGAPLDAIIQAAWQTDHNHIEKQAEFPKTAYRFAATVPKGRETELLPALQEALQRTFGFHAQWEERQRDVLVLTRLDTTPLRESASEPSSMFMRGKITMRAQTSARLATMLPNWLGKPVVDETGLSGHYDFDLEYRDDGPSVLTEGLREKYGLAVTPARRNVRILVIRSSQP